MSPGVVVSGEAKPLRRSRSESESEEGVESLAADPKRDELPMARVKAG